MITRLHAPLRYLCLIAVCWFVIFMTTRCVLWLSNLNEAGSGALSMLGIGSLYDLAFLVYAILPLGLYVLLCPPALWRTRGHRWFLQGIMTLSLFVMLFVATAEWLFWDEFGVRFNFIAVDYLVYSDEVLNNILESYPIGKLLSALALVAIGLSFLLLKPVAAAVKAGLPSWRQRLTTVVALVLVAGLVLEMVDQDTPRGLGGNVYQRELASNGPYQFFAAFRNNELDYPQFYSTLPRIDAARLIRAELNEPNAVFTGTDPLDIRRSIDNPGTLRKTNIILVTIESLSAKYLGSCTNAIAALMSLRLYLKPGSITWA
jgi:phosphoglycerol transferase MdoB-like AlkP superfamily enzyme